MKQKFDTPWARCPACKDQVAIEAKHIVSYFEARPIRCPNCGIDLDWWKIACREVEANFMYNLPFYFIGAQSLSFQIMLQPGTRRIFRLTEYGIPADAKILYINYTPQGPNLWPLEIHGNTPMRKRDRQEIALYPAPPPNEVGVETEVAVWVSWVHGTADDESWQSLVDAFEAHCNEAYPSMVVPANVAVEATLSRLMTVYLEKFISKKTVEDFLDNAATYSHQLNVMLPLVASINSLPLLPDHIKGSLNRLRKLRNQLAHRGTLEKALDSKASAELLCSALFGLQYIRHLKSLLKL
jgi:hypothetical protein